MVVSSIVRRLLIALVMCSAAVAAFSSPVSARSYRHHAWHATHVRHVASHARHYADPRHAEAMAGGPSWDMTGTSNWDRAVITLRQLRFAHVQASVMPGVTQGAPAMSGGFGGGSELVSEARKYVGGNPTSRGSLWCARFMNMVLERTGHHGTGS